MRLTNEVKDILKKRVNAIYEKKRDELEKQYKPIEDSLEEFLDSLTKNLKTTLANKLSSFEKKKKITVLNKEELLEHIYVTKTWNIPFKTKEAEDLLNFKHDLREKCDKAYEDLVLRLTFNKDITTLDEEFKKIEESL